MERGGGGKFSIASFRRNQAMGIVYRYATHDSSRGRRARKRPRTGDKETYKTRARRYVVLNSVLMTCKGYLSVVRDVGCQVLRGALLWRQPAKVGGRVASAAGGGLRWIGEANKARRENARNASGG